MHAHHASPAKIAALRGITARALDAAITRSEEVAPGLPIETSLLSGPSARRGADLVAVHTWYWLPFAASASGPAAVLRPPDPAQISAEAGRHLTAALEQWHGKYPEVRVRQDVIRGHPARVLASYSARADLVVLGRHGHPAGPGPGIGSIQHAVLDHAPRSGRHRRSGD